MALNFPNVSVLGLSRDTKFFQAGFWYSTAKNLSIAGNVTDLTETFGITGVWTGQEGILATIANNNNYQGFVINGTDFGSGRIQNINFDAGIDVRVKGYQANIVVYDSGNLFNFTGEYYSGIDTNNFQYLLNFNENYSFNKKLNGGYSYSHNAGIQFTSGVGQLNSIQAAQSLAKTLFTGSNLGFAFYPAFTDKQGKRYFTESYDIISNNCSFQETFDFDNNNGNYSAIYTHSINRDLNGIVSAVESAQIRGIENPNYQKALSAVSEVITGAYYRCSGVVSFYFPTGAVLIDYPITQSRLIDIFNNNINYNVEYNNSINNRRTYFWDYTLTINKNDGVSTASENGEIVGRGENNIIAFQNAQSGFVVVKNGIQGRCSSLFVDPYLPSTNYLESKNETYSPVKAILGYSYEYSNDPTLIANSGVRRKSVTIDYNNPTYSYTNVGVMNQSEIAQDNYQSSQGSQKISVVMEGDKTVGLQNFIGIAQTEFNLNKPVGNDVYISEAQYNYDITQNSAQVELTWLYNESASTSNYPS